MFPWDFFHALTTENPSDVILLVLYWDPAAGGGKGALESHYPPAVYFGKTLWDQIQTDTMSPLPSSIADLAIIKRSLFWSSPVLRGYVNPGREPTEIWADARGRLRQLLERFRSGAGVRRSSPRPTAPATGRETGRRKRSGNHGHSKKSPPGGVGRLDRGGNKTRNADVGRSTTRTTRGKEKT